MASFGDKLRREREMRRITLDEIAESTKISRRHLESLEKEDFASLPGGVFNKGFVKAYARYLGIDEDQAAADYAAVANEPAPEEDKFPLEIHEKPKPELNPRNSRFPLVLAVAALIGVVIGYTLWARNKKPQLEGSESVSANTQPVASAESGPVTENPKPEAAPVAMHPKVPVRSDVAEAGPADKHAGAQERTFSVVIKAKEDAWISVIADGRTVAEGVLRADRQKLVKAAKQIQVKTGNAGGIEISYNGKPVGAIGSESETRTLMFTSSGPAQ